MEPVGERLLGVRAERSCRAASAPDSLVRRQIEAGGSFPRDFRDGLSQCRAAPRDRGVGLRAIRVREGRGHAGEKAQRLIRLKSRPGDEVEPQVVGVVLDPRGAASEERARVAEDDVGEFVGDDERELGVGAHEANHAFTHLDLAAGRPGDHLLGGRKHHRRIADRHRHDLGHPLIRAPPDQQPQGRPAALAHGAEQDLAALSRRPHAVDRQDFIAATQARPVRRRPGHGVEESWRVAAPPPIVIGVPVRLGEGALRRHR